MPHQCVRCKATFEDGSATILSGCACGSKYFFFFKESDMKEKITHLNATQIIELEEDIDELIGDVDEDRPVILDLESIRMSEPGKYEIDLTNLFKKKPVIYQMKEGQYIIDLASTFHNMMPDNKKGKKK